jgi:hypothetical protein
MSSLHYTNNVAKVSAWILTTSLKNLFNYSSSMTERLVMLRSYVILQETKRIKPHSIHQYIEIRNEYHSDIIPGSFFS